MTQIRISKQLGEQVLRQFIHPIFSEQPDHLEVYPLYEDIGRGRNICAQCIMQLSRHIRDRLNGVE